MSVNLKVVGEEVHQTWPEKLPKQFAGAYTRYLKAKMDVQNLNASIDDSDPDPDATANRILDELWDAEAAMALTPAFGRESLCHKIGILEDALVDVATRGERSDNWHFTMLASIKADAIRLLEGARGW